MSNLQKLQYFVNERLSAAALEIFGAVDKTINEYREEICFAKEENVRLQQLLLDMEIKYRAELQQLRGPEPPQIKQEPDPQSSPWEDRAQHQGQEAQSSPWEDRAQHQGQEPQSSPWEDRAQHQGQEGQVKSVTFTPPRVERECVEEDASYLSHLYQAVESREEEPSQPGPIKTECDGRAYGASEPANHSQSLSVDGRAYRASEPANHSQPLSVVIPNYPPAHSSEEDESGGILPELDPRKLTQMMQTNTISPIDSRGTSEMELTVEVLPGTKKPFQCPERSKRSTSFHSVQSHAKSHTGALANQGPQYRNTFDSGSHLTVHMRSHTGERPRQFQEYARRFKHSHNLALHMRNHTGAKPYQCQECGKSFSQKRYLLAHLKTHAQLKPHHCQVCGKGFITVRNVRVHMRIHTGEKPYQCPECSRSFRQKSHLDAHMKTHREGTI